MLLSYHEKCLFRLTERYMIRSNLINRTQEVAFWVALDGMV